MATTGRADVDDARAQQADPPRAPPRVWRRGLTVGPQTTASGESHASRAGQLAPQVLKMAVCRTDRPLILGDADTATPSLVRLPTRSCRWDGVPAADRCALCWSICQGRISRRPELTCSARLDIVVAVSRSPKRIATPDAATSTSKRRRDKTKLRGSALTAGDDGSMMQRPSRVEVLCWVALLAAAVGALVWKHCTVFFLAWTDEQIHFYVARRMVEGAVLYRDIDSARPPLVLFPLAWLIKLGTSPMLAGRSLVVASEVAAATLLLWGGWRLVSWRAGALAALLFLTSPETFSRIHYTGIHLATLTASACVLFALRGQALKAGLCLGLSLVGDQHGLAICGIVAVVTFARRPKDALVLATGALGICLVGFGSVWIMGGRHLWKSLVEIHLFHLRPGQGGSDHFWEIATPWLYEHGYLFAAAALAAALLALRRTEAKSDASKPPSSRVVRVLLLAVCGHVAVVLAMTEAAFLYFVVLTPLLTLLAGIGLDAAIGRWRQRKHSTSAQAPAVSRVMAVEISALVALVVGGWTMARSHREGLDERHYSFWPHVLHGQVSLFHRLDVAHQIATDSAMPKSGTIFGDPTIVSAVALESGKRVSGELADLNPSWIQAGVVSREEVVSRIEHDGVAAMITPPWFLVQDPYFRSYLAACYQEPKVFLPPEGGPGAGLPEVLLFPHVPGEGACQVPRL